MRLFVLRFKFFHTFTNYFLVDFCEALDLDMDEKIKISGVNADVISE